ncbi:AP-1-like transcription factor [Achaetomium macrosporum]|uniref:AP-1-like transcription factor n=1 Tax=Achaetomium macrosporum TaxID=79813 RepID=A0AAN7CDY2_9PEZI|nr:AP-1-like transcription factor [Achaetomium macrosporum]
MASSSTSGSRKFTYEIVLDPPGLRHKRSYGGPADGREGGTSRGAAAEPPDPAIGQVRPALGGATGHGSPPVSASAATSPPPPPTITTATLTTLQQVKGYDDHTQGLPSADTPASSTDAATAPASKKRKTSRGSRGVANLTPEQLERKRANDREAQRAIRERQRAQRMRYEREIAELKSQQPYQELQGVLRQKEAVEAELAEMKSRLATIVGMIQPLLARPAPGAVGSPSTHTTTMAPTAHIPGSTPTSATSSVSVGTHHGRWRSSLSPVMSPGSLDGPPQPPSELELLQQQRYDLVHGLELGSERLTFDFLVDPKVGVTTIQKGVNGAQDSPQYRHVPMKHERSSTISMVANLQTQQQQAQSPISSLATNLPPSTLFPPPPTTPSTVAQRPIYTITPRNCAATCPLDSILLDFLAERRQRFAEGLSPTEIAGPRYPSVSSLLNPTISAFSHPLSKVFTDILARFPDLATLPERVAVLYMMFLLMRWQVHPTRENYLRLPEWFRPFRVQLEREHPAWFDHLPFPKMREKLVREYGVYDFPFENFFIPFTRTLSLNWPYEDAHVLLADPKGNELMINPVFEQHIKVLANWTLGEAFERAFPALTGLINVKKGT